MTWLSHALNTSYQLTHTHTHTYIPFVLVVAGNGYQETFPGAGRHNVQGAKETKGPEEEKEEGSQRATKVSSKTHVSPPSVSPPTYLNYFDRLLKDFISSRIIRC